MAAKLTRLTHKIAIQLHLVAENCTICSSRSRRPVRRLLDTPSYIAPHIHVESNYRENLECWYRSYTVTVSLQHNSVGFISDQQV
jgi:hypothetical protein